MPDDKPTYEDHEADVQLYDEDEQAAPEPEADDQPDPETGETPAETQARQLAEARKLFP